MSELSAKPEARDMEFAPTLSRCEAARALGRFRSDSAWSPARCAGPRSASLRSKLPHCPLLRASFQSNTLKALATSSPASFSSSWAWVSSPSVMQADPAPPLSRRASS